MRAPNIPPRNTFVRLTWLHYYNDYLRKAQIISEDEWRKMRRKIGEN